MKKRNRHVTDAYCFRTFGSVGRKFDRKNKHANMPLFNFDVDTGDSFEDAFKKNIKDTFEG